MLNAIKARITATANMIIATTISRAECAKFSKEFV